MIQILLVLLIVVVFYGLYYATRPSDDVFFDTNEEGEVEEIPVAPVTNKQMTPEQIRDMFERDKEHAFYS